MSRLKVFLPVLGLAMFSVTLAGCGDGDDASEPPNPAATASRSASVSRSGSDISVNLRNWAVEPSQTEIAAGTYTFTATHEEEGHGGDHGAESGGAIHQLVIARLPDGASPGESKFGRPVLNLTDIKPGEEKSGEAMLEPGRYELSCLVVEKVGGKDINHYAEGMYTLLTVE